MQSRYYDPEVGRFIHADSQLTTGNVSGMNLFAYCGNNPVNRIDLTGEAWWHWAIGAAVVIGCALLTVATAGGFALGATAIGLAVSGISAGGTASIFAAATVSAAMALGTSALIAASNSNSVRDFCAQGNWGTVTGTAFGAV